MLQTETIIPTDAREMHENIFLNETIELSPEIILLLSSFQNITATDKIEAGFDKTSSLQPLLDSLQQKTLIVDESLKEQIAARTLLFRFGLPYLPEAEEVWFTLSEYLVNAKETTEQSQLELKLAIEQIKALLINQLVTEQENQLQTLIIKENQHKQGITTLQKTETNLVEENQLISQNGEAIKQKKEQLTVISAQKKQIKNSIESMKAMISNLLAGFAKINQFNSAQPVMA